jgi:hypothetical protein
MSFLKITDPAKRDFIVEEFLKSKKNIRQNFLSERLGDIGLQRELTRLYKPIVDSQSTISEEQKALLSTIKENSAETANALKALPASISKSLKAIQFPQQPSIEAYEGDPIEDIKTLELGPIAAKYLLQYAANKKLVDTTFGINYKEEDGKFYIGDSPITINYDNVTVGDKTYDGTPGLWELLTMANPDKSIYDDNDLEEYAEILKVTNAMRQPKNPSKPKSSRSNKYRKIIKPIWEETVGMTQGKGIQRIVIPQDPNALVEMLSLRMASFEAGNTGVRNEIVGICDELLRQGAINKNQYKNIMVLI